MISIIIPCYGHRDVLPRAIASALSQGPDIEVVVVDDGNSPPLVNAFDDPRVKIFRHRKNRGLSAALNSGIRRSRGDRFVILAADDQLGPRHLAKLSVHNADIVSCDMMVGGKHIHAGPGSLDRLMVANCHSYAALVKRWVWEETGGFKLDMNPSWEDYEFWLNAAKIGAKWAHVPEPLHIYNRNPVGRDAIAQGKDFLLMGLLHSHHRDIFGKGRGLVTFVIPCYNHERYVADAVESALRQTYRNVAVVVVDDGSPGDVETALSEFHNRSNVFLVSQSNRGLASARNAGIKFAMKKLGSEYFVMLDADDQVHPEFVERTLGAYAGDRYVYTDIHFIGDAWHKYEVDDYVCRKLSRKHLHACTFLMPSRMWQDVVTRRGYGYDESDTMRIGWEDWEFALACVESGWCGERLSQPLFYYRNYADGSNMRVNASRHRKMLSRYIQSKHPWVRSSAEVIAVCTSCGRSSRYARSRVNTVVGGGVMFVQGVGEVAPDEPLAVAYTGPTTSTITKVAPGGTIYKYSADPTGTYGPNFVIKAVHAHLFTGPYSIQKLRDKKVVGATAAGAPATTPDVVEQVIIREKVPVPAPSAPPGEPRVTEEFEPRLVEDWEYEIDDFTIVKGIGKVGQQKLEEAGIPYYEDFLDASNDELAIILGVDPGAIPAYKDQVEEAMEEEDGEDDE